ncbi:alpha-glucosyltransferase [Phenylobacterium zucineum HLK1]|uniref:Alpha-glucosyltransferase n=1 Tax=Phenylobacterium zucineum (strain HLK1) TaxID=450851 RepID=B4RA44_PHEZH|nr:alpha-glucosidase family protein [Phenylobacterium zucineum]ACG79548.1 alpha-glucosyltransferase [Phenylobacterium zucineum HLK1]
MTPWWKGAVLYHVYVRSFYDSDGDGHGDLPGVQAKLDYIASLGVDGIWLSPIHPSPNRDWGYDIADFEGVQADYGRPEDFRRLLDAAHRRGLKVVLDEVLSHTSDEHPWFVESLTGGPTGPKADWYVWADPKPDGTAPNNWLSVFGGPAWAYQPKRRQHYHHKFLRQQPKLNWRNPAAREAALSVLDFWLEKGVDGFRLDVAGTYLHDADLTDNPPVPVDERTRLHWSHAGNLQRHLHDSNLPENIEVLDAIRRRVEAHGEDRFVFGEFSEEEARCGAYCSHEDGLHSGYTFVMLLARKLDPGFVREHYRTLSDYPLHWPTISFSNHDVPRTVSRFGGGADTPDLARMLFALLVALKGTTLVYQGEELGLPQATLTRDQLRDPVGDLYWPYDGGRDGCRTPMPWQPGETLGFTTGTPWLPPAAEHRGLTVAEQEKDPDSTLAFARRMIAFKKDSAALRLGELTFLDLAEPVLAFVREHAGERIACLFNFSAEPRFLDAPQLAGAQLLPVRAGDADLRGGSIGLSPHAAAFLRLA